MKFVKYAFLMIISVAFFAGCNRMGASSLLADELEVIDIIKQMPAENSQIRDELAAELAALNPQATILLSKRLLPPTDPNDDNEARYGLSALTDYVGRSGMETERAVYAAALLEALAMVPDKQNKAFLIGQLQLVGKEEAVAPLGEFLNDDVLCDDAARALLTIGTESVEGVFLKALRSAEGKSKVSIIKALGQLQCAAAVKVITPYTQSSDFNIRQMALYALANIGDPSSQEILADAIGAEDAYQRAKYATLYLLFARRQADAGNINLCSQICSELIQQCGDEPSLRIAAINTLRSEIGDEKLNLITDPELRKQVQEYITQPSDEASAKQPPEGFISLFNGKDLTGWKRHDGLPGEEHPTGKWAVENGTIVGIQDPPGAGGFLTTTETFRDFELLLETKIDWPFDTGVFLRVGPDGKSHQVTLDYRPDGEIGEIYCPWTHGSVHHCPDGINYFKKDQWNQLRIICQGQPAHIQVWLNDTLITDFQHTEETTAGVPQEGTICLQVHPGGEGYDKSKAYFRNIFIRPIDSAEAANHLTGQEKADGFVSLFNGRDLSGWVGATDGYGAENGVLFCRKDTGRNIYTEKEYDNFVIRFEFKLEPGANNGLGIRAPLEGDASHLGIELQILDNTAAKYNNLHEWQYHGSVYGVVPAKRGFLKPVGTWNKEEVIADGSHITVNLNGTTIVDADIEQASKDGTMDGVAHPGLLNKTGHIAFLGHGDYLEFRNIRIKEL